MAVGSYGTIRPADVSPDDVEILLHYVADRSAAADVSLTKLTPSEVLTPVFHNQNTGGLNGVELLGGMYNLRLSTDNFDQIGIYTLHIRPKQIRTSITDCGVLSSLPSVRGIVLDLSDVSEADRNKFVPQGLVGYRVEYIDINTQQKVPNFYKVVTSSFYCEPVTTNLTNSVQKSIRYRYTDTPTNLLFLTVTPSSSPTTRPTIVPFIGQPGQTVILTNSFFNPTTIEVEMVEHDISTLALALYGNQSKAVSSGIYTIYDNNNDNNIYKQFNLYEVKDEFNETLYEIREERTDIDQTLNFDDITE
jgi:hypothetical protein